VIIFIQFSQNNLKLQFKKIFEMKFAYVTNDTTETYIKNHIYHYTTPHETIICNSDGVISDHIAHQQEQY
jgi:hypothetical protein